MNEIDFEIEVKKDQYLNTIKDLRSNNFGRGIPFLILSDKLPEGQVYREFSDGHIELQEVFIERQKFKSKVIKTLSAKEADKVRAENGLL